MFRFCVLCLCLIFLAQNNTNAQTQTLHNTLAKGTLNISGGLHFQNIKGNNTTSSIQYSAGINYCFKHHYTLGLNANTLRINLENLQSNTFWSSENLFLGINLQRIDHLFKTQMGKFKLASILTVNGGSIFSTDEFTEQLQTKKSGFSSTGYYTSGAISLRFEFVRRLFLEATKSVGFFAKNNVNLRTQNQAKLATNSWYTDTHIKIGIFMFINTLDKCGTCPKW